jgi:mannose-6-phosphate isomerase
MINPVMAYAWGSRDGIASLQGRPPAQQPEAELWMGAHPNAPSELEGSGDAADARLDAVIDADPAAVLGSAVVSRFGPRLPFMLKVLAAGEPLSLQVHPDDVRAREGFEAEEAAGIDRAAPQRSYRDPYAKPEMLVAIDDFEVLLGFRPAAEAAESLAALGVRRLDPIVDALRAGLPTGEALLRLVAWPEGHRERLVADVGASARASASTSDARHAAWVASGAQRYPADPGVVGVYLLNHLTLRPGQGIFVAPGQIHAYLRGTGVEILGGSDNVIRGGLTPKHVNVDELRAVLAVQPIRPSVIEAVTQADGEQRWPAPRAEFALARVQLDGGRRVLAPRGPSILFCLEGKVDVGTADATLTITGGESVFAAANAGAVTVVGTGVLLRATTGLQQTEARTDT